MQEEDCSQMANNPRFSHILYTKLKNRLLQNMGVKICTYFFYLGQYPEERKNIYARVSLYIEGNITGDIILCRQ